MQRRPIRARETTWARSASRWLQQHGATPNGISIVSVVFSIIAALSFGFCFHVPDILGRCLLVIAALTIQLRLICNLLDGMVAVEGGMKSPSGDVYNDFPDRLSDAITLLGVGYGLTLWPWATDLAWAAALSAVMTAYVRLLGGAIGLPQRFSGPFAKQQRMVVLTAAAVIAALLPFQNGQWVLLIALIVVLIGTVLTVVRRLLDLVRELEKR